MESCLLGGESEGEVKVKIAQSCPTLCKPMDYTVHWILQARILEWVAFLSPGDLPIQGSNSGLLHCRWVLYQLSYQGIPESIFFFKIYFNWRLITLQYCGSFCHTFTWISHGCTFVPHLENPSHLSLHPIPQGHPSAPALSTLSHASNLDWRAVSHMVIYMFQCYSLKSSHPHLLPQSPKVCSLHLMSKSVYVCLSVCVCV